MKGLEHLRENMKPLERQSKSALKALKQELDPQLLYSYQLMSYLLEGDRSGLPPKDLDDVKSALQVFQESPKGLQRFLLGEDPNESLDLSRMKDLSPLEKGQFLLNRLRSKMLESDPPLLLGKENPILKEPKPRPR